MTRPGWLAGFAVAALLAGSCTGAPPDIVAQDRGAACQAASDGGPLHSDRGVGGTGRPARPAGVADKGIGGTGIAGIITGFASVCLNGLEVGLESDTTIEIDGEPAAASALRAGQFAEITAVTGPDGSLSATHLAIRHDLAGMIEAIDGDELRIAGRRAILPQGTPDAGLARLGAIIAISGVRRFDGAVVASRIEPPSRPAPTASDIAPTRQVTTPGLPVRRLVLQAFVRARDGQLELGSGQVLSATPATLAELARISSETPPLTVISVTVQADGSLLATRIEDRSGRGAGTPTMLTPGRQAGPNTPAGPGNAPGPGGGKRP